MSDGEKKGSKSGRPVEAGDGGNAYASAASELKLVAKLLTSASAHAAFAGVAAAMGRTEHADGSAKLARVEAEDAIRRAQRALEMLRKDGGGDGE